MKSWKGKSESDHNRYQKGSTTVEAAIVLPFFLVALFTLAYLIRIFMAYSAMQSALQNVARNISSASYFYYVSGLKDYSDKLDDKAEEASDELAEQKDVILGAVTNFNDSISSLNGQSVSMDNLDQSIDKFNDMGQTLISDADKVNQLVTEVLKDPKAEGKLLMTVFTQKVSYEVRKQLVCAVSKHMLDAELNKSKVAGSGSDVYGTLGIGKAQINLDQTQVFGDRESLEFIVNYPVKAPLPFNLIPEVQLSNRVKLIAWTGGRGQSVRASPKEEEEKNEDSSIWVEMDQDQRYWDRGLEIEKIEVQKLNNTKESGFTFIATDTKFPKVDAFLYNDKVIRAYDVFTLNPYMQTYQSSQSRIKSEMKKHAKRLMEFEFENYPGFPQELKKERIVIMIIPENSPPGVDELYLKVKDELIRLGIDDFLLVRGYGGYSVPDETSQAVSGL